MELAIGKRVITGEQELDKLIEKLNGVSDLAEKECEENRMRYKTRLESLSQSEFDQISALSSEHSGDMDRTRNRYIGMGIQLYEKIMERAEAFGWLFENGKFQFEFSDSLTYVPQFKMEYRTKSAQTMKKLE